MSRKENCIDSSQSFFMLAFWPFASKIFCCIDGKKKEEEEEKNGESSDGEAKGD